MTRQLSNSLSERRAAALLRSKRLVPIRFFDHPQYVELTTYETAIERVVETLVKEGDIIAIYQLGSVGAPGISDIDLLVVTNERPGLATDPFEQLDPDERYLFTHKLFSISASDVEQLRRFTCFHHYRLKWGSNVIPGHPACGDVPISQLKRQVALEYLLSNFIGRSIELEYRLVSLRKLMLSIHAIRYDLEFLGVTDGPFAELVEQMAAWRHAWFEKPPGERAVTQWLVQFRRELWTFLEQQLEANYFYLAGDFPSRLSRHITLRQAERLSVNHRGLTRLTGVAGSYGKKLLNRINHFTFEIPFQNVAASEFVSERVRFFQRLVREHASKSSYAQPPITSIQYSILRADEALN